MSPLVSNLTETADSLSTVRAYGMVDRFCRHNCRLTDSYIQAQVTHCDSYRFVKMAAAACGSFVVLATLLLNIARMPSGDTMKLTEVGLALTAASSASTQPGLQT